MRIYVVEDVATNRLIYVGIDRREVMDIVNDDNKYLVKEYKKRYSTDNISRMAEEVIRIYGA